MAGPPGTAGWTCAVVWACLVGALAARELPLWEATINLLLRGAAQSSLEPRDDPNLQPEYDFIVVGAGTGGCTVTSRLTEIPDWEVLLLEAGIEENFVMDVPILANFLQFTDANWGYKSEPSSSACLGLENRQCKLPRGKVMGGSSVLNYMIYNRGNRRDYDRWEKMGNTGWGYDDVLKYFLKSEDMVEPDLAENTKYHNTGGPLTVSYPVYRTPLAEAFIDAGIQLGSKVVDYDAETQSGYAYLHSNLNNGTRWSASRAFLHSIRNRPNLHVKKRSQVTKILIDPDTKTAYGVEFVLNGQTYTVRARKEVILSAGAINSPQLLMLSGIGPRKHLSELNIPILQDLKVGYNLMDHAAKGGLTFILNESLSLRTEFIIANRKNLYDYFSYHRGPIAVPGGCEALAFYEMNDPDNPDGWPDMELLFQAGSVNSEQSLRRNFGIDDALYEAVYQPIDDQHTWMILPIVLRPKSRGRIMLRDKDPFSHPRIYPNYYARKEDADVMVWGIKKSIELSQTPAMHKYGSKLHDIPIPACAALGFGTDKYWECAARHLTFTMYHQSGTCKMGPKSDRSAVVDPRLRVHGIKRLRVVDASIFPEIPAAHTNAPVYMIGEKAADMIKEDWGKL